MHITQYQYQLLLLLLLLWVFACNRLSHAATARWYESKTRCLNPPRTARRVEIVIAQCQEEVKNKLVHEALQILREEMMAPGEKNSISFSYGQTTSIYPTDLMPPLAERPPTATAWNAQYAPTGLANAHVHAHAHDEVEQEEEEEEGEEEVEVIELQQQHQQQEVGEHGHMSFVTTTESGMQQYVFLPTVPAKLRRARTPRLTHRSYHSDRIYTPMLVPLEDKRIAGCLLHCVYAKNNAIDALGWPTLDGLVHFYSEGVSEHGFFMATLQAVNRCLHAVTRRYRVDRWQLPQQGESCDLAFDVFDCISDQITGYCLDEYA